MTSFFSKESPYYLPIVSLPALMAFLGSRTVSKIEVGPVFLLDIFMGISIIYVLISNIRFQNLRAPNVLTSVAFLSLPVFSLLRLPFGSISSEALRDVYPYLMLVYGLLVSVCARGASRRNSRILVVSFLAVIALHWLWVIATWSVTGSLDSNFEFIRLRADLDGSLIGLLGALLWVRGARSEGYRRLGYYLATVIVTVHAATFGESRAAAVASFVTMSLVLSTEIARRVNNGLQWKLIFLNGLGVLLAMILITGLGNPEKAAKFVGGFVEVSERAGVAVLEPIADSTSVDRGTSSARLEGWSRVLGYTLESPERTLLGSGPGSNYFQLSGGAAALLGEEASQRPDASRHPHSALIHTLALLGLPASAWMLLLFLVPMLSATRYMLRKTDPLVEISTAAIVALGVPALFGVIFEGPYGSIPAACCLGILVARLSDLRRTDSSTRRIPGSNWEK